MEGRQVYRESGLAIFCSRGHVARWATLSIFENCFVPACKGLSSLNGLRAVVGYQPQQRLQRELLQRLPELCRQQPYYDSRKICICSSIKEASGMREVLQIPLVTVQVRCKRGFLGLLVLT